jgi:hypothetical protein
MGRWAVAFVAGGVGFAALLAAELVVRQFPDLMPVQEQQLQAAIHSPFLATVPDPDVGFLPAPRLHERFQTDVVSGTYETDSRGFPNPDPWPERPAFVFLGDSMVQGHDVGFRRSFPHLVGTLLSVGVVNLAVQASGPERQLAIYRKFGAPLRPAAVVACLYVTSDLRSDEHFRRWVREGKPGDYDEYRLSLARTRRSWFERLSSRSWVYSHMRETVRKWFLPSYTPERYTFPDGQEVLFNRGNLNFAVAEVAPGDPRISQMVSSLLRLRKTVEATGGTLLVALIPSLEEVFGVPRAATRHNLVEAARRGLKDAGLLVIDLYPVIEAGGASAAPYLQMGSHFNEYGNRLAARAIAAWPGRHLPGLARTIGRLRESPGN